MSDTAMPPDVQTTPGRILIVDDVADNRAVLGRRFQRRGFEIAEADSGKKALDAIAAEEFDVVLLDVVMPDMDGMAVLKRIRETHSEIALPVIMVTGRSESEHVVEALSAGANDYITKPVDFAVALLRVSTQIGRRRAEEQVRRANEALTAANSDLERRIAERTAELVQTNAQLRAAMEAAEAANRAKDDFLATVSHELRTPLNGLLPMAAMLAQSELSEPQRKMVEIIRSSADGMLEVVSDLLDTLDLLTRGLSLTPAPVAVGELVREAAERHAGRARDKGLAFQLAIDPAAEGRVETDGKRLRQVLDKVMDNAVKFTEHGEVAVSVRRPAPDRLQIEVRDTGIGFDPAIAERLFRPFEQSDGSLTRRYGGVGLGLGISRGIVEAMGGAISAEGQPGAGALFRIILPLPPAA
jgi:signal transduction histidine kinase